MTTVILLLALFGIKHFVCDFLLQYPHMVAQKGTYGARGGLEHAAIHAVGTVIVLFLVLPWDPVVHVAALVFGLFDGLIHYHVDWTKQQVSRGLTTSDRMFWVWFGADQTLHYLTYIAIIGVIVLA